MTDISVFATLAALIIGGFSFIAFLFTRVDRRLDRHEDRLDALTAQMRALRDEVRDEAAALRTEMRADSAALRRDLAEEFRAQRAEAAAQIAAVTNAIIASRGGA